MGGRYGRYGGRRRFGGTDGCAEPNLRTTVTELGNTRTSSTLLHGLLELEQSNNRSNKFFSLFLFIHQRGVEFAYSITLSAPHN